MAKQASGKSYEFSLGDEIFNSMAMFLVFGMLFGFVINIVTVLMGNHGNMMLWIIICMAIFGGIGIGYAFKLRKFNKELGIRKGNDYTIEKVKEFFGAPVNILEDKDCSYYTFREEIIGMFARTHTFTVNKKGIVIKHEVTSIETNKKD